MSGPEEDKEQMTTVRAAVTMVEHAVIKHAARVQFNATIDDFVRAAIDTQLKALTGKSLATLAKEAAKRPKLVQMELFG